MKILNMRILGAGFLALALASLVGVSSYAGTGYVQFQYESDLVNPADHALANDINHVPETDTYNRSMNPGQQYNICSQTAAIPGNDQYGENPNLPGCPVDFYCSQSLSGEGICDLIPTNDW